LWPKSRGYYWAKWICFDANESFKSSWIYWSFENIWLFDEFVEFQRSRYSSNEYHNKCVECVEYLKKCAELYEMYAKSNIDLSMQ
jgi:hypothetical protein